MADTRCSCGFTETAGETITDHLLEAFVPEDGLGSDGLVHEEVQPDLTSRAASPRPRPADWTRISCEPSRPAI